MADKFTLQYVGFREPAPTERKYREPCSSYILRMNGEFVAEFTDKYITDRRFHYGVVSASKSSLQAFWKAIYTEYVQNLASRAEALGMQVTRKGA